MKAAIQHLILLLKRLAVVLVLYSVCRLIFLISNYEVFQSTSMARAFIGGLRFDLSAIALSNMPVILLSLLPIPWISSRKYQRFILVLMLLLNIPCLALNLLDTEYFKFTSKRATADFFDLMFLSDDMATLLPSYIKDYWYLFLILGLFIWVAIRYIRSARFSNLVDLKLHYGWQLIALVLTMGLAILSIRGGTQLRPIDNLSALDHGEPTDIPLIINTPFSIIRSWNKDFKVRRTYMSDEEMNLLFNPQHLPNGGNEMDTKNVVIIIMESFSKEYVGERAPNGLPYTPFLDSLAEVGVGFEESFANGRTSIAALPSILSGLPALMDQPFITSPYSQTPTDALPYLLSKYGYTSHFYHGGRTGTMGFDRYCKSAGFNNYTGLEDYPDPADYDGNWGIYDRPFFSHVANELSRKKEPFLATLFSLSSHHPYGIPKSLEDQYAIYTEDLGRSVRYADDALRDFFKIMEEGQKLENTLFIVTADHIPMPKDISFATRIGCFSVPIVFYDQSDGLKSNRTLAQQVDIMPTVVDYLGLPEGYISWGTSIQSAEKGWAVQYIDNFYQLYQDGYLLQYNGKEHVRLSRGDNEKVLLEEPVKDTMLKRLQAMIQQYDNRLIDGRLRSGE